MASDRMVKIDELVKNQISVVIREIFPEKIVSVTQVHVSKDLSYAKVWISSIDDLESIIKEYQNHSSEIRKYLADKVVLRKVPKLHFVADNTETEADNIEKLIKKIKE